MARIMLHLLALSVALLFAQTEAGLYSSSTPVLQLDSSNWKLKLKAAGGALVELYAPWCGHCKSLVPEYEKAAQALKGLVTVASIDADEHKDLAQEFGVKGFPTIKFVWFDGDKMKMSDYDGARQAKEMVTWTMDKAKNLALKRIGEKPSSGGGSKGAGGGGGGGGADDGFYKGTDVVTLTDSNFAKQVASSGDVWFVEFYAPWCGHCKSLKPVWIESASQLKGKVKLGAVDCTVHQNVCQEFGVKGYPTIKFFGANKGSPEDYQGARDTAAIVDFGNKRWSKATPPPEVHELTSQAVWEKECTGREGEGEDAVSPKQLCFVAFLPHILDSKAAGRNKYIATLKKIASSHKDKSYAYLWAQGGSQSGLEASLNVADSGYPAFVAYKPGKDNKFSNARVAFEESKLTSFIEGISTRRETVLAVQGDLAPIKSTEKWNGKDATVEVEDEFSLEDLEGEL